MTADIQTLDSVVLNPVTGEVINLANAPLADVARLLDEVRQLETHLRDLKRTVSEHVLAGMDRQASWTLRGGGYELRSSSPVPAVTYDAAALHAALLELVDQGALDRSAVAAAVQEIVDYKPIARGINALTKLGGIVADTIAQHRTEAPKQRYVTVRPST